MMTVRDAVLSDSADIARLTVELGYEANEKTINLRLGKIVSLKDYLVLVALIEDKIVGWLQAHACEVLESGYRVEIVGLIVASDHRRSGIGRSLVQRAEQWAVMIGAEAAVVRSNAKRVESHSFYPALGFCLSKTQAVYRKRLFQLPTN
jgi:GNAT superfamily N-acetyltransferase